MYPWEIWWHGKTHTVWLLPCCMGFVIQYGFCHAIASLTLGERWHRDRVPVWLEKSSGSGNLTRRDRASHQGEVWKPLDYISRNVQQQQVGRLRANPLRKQTLSSCHIAIEQQSLSSAKKKQPYHVNQHSAAQSLFLETDSTSLGIKRRKCFSSNLRIDPQIVWGQRSDQPVRRAWKKTVCVCSPPTPDLSCHPLFFILSPSFVFARAPYPKPNVIHR